MIRRRAYVSGSFRQVDHPVSGHNESLKHEYNMQIQAHICKVSILGKGVGWSILDPKIALRCAPDNLAHP
jgi:hypothetical protein